MTRKLVSPAEERRILAQPSPLEPKTRRILIQAARDGERMIRERDDEVGVDLGELRQWLNGQPHVAWCLCVECKAGKAAAE